MNEFPNLFHPPVVEAIFDVQVIFPKGIELSALAGLHSHFMNTYPRKEEQRVVEFEFHQGEGQMSESRTRDHGITGYRFLSGDGVELVQCRRDGFTFNRLKPYTDWQDAFRKAVHAWTVYQEAFPQAQVTRVALRYINLIEVLANTPTLDLSEYFSVSVPGPHLTGVASTGFMSQGVLHDENTNLDANWIFARQPSTDPSKIVVALDVDVYAQGTRVSDMAVNQWWEVMRNLKNRLFFGSLTQKGIKLFQ